MTRLPRLGPAGLLLAGALALALAGCPAHAPTGSGARAPAASQPAAVASVPAPVPLAEARVTFAPLTGPPQPVADMLAEAVARESMARSVTLAPFGAAEAHYVVKGYLSAAATGGGVEAVYVWDVLDTELRRLHRITGRVPTNRRAAEPWAAIDATVLDHLARQSVGALAAWLSAG